MSVNASTAFSGPFTPNSVTVAFPFNFPCQSVADVAVLQNDVPLTNGLSITLNADQLDNPGGAVTFVAAPLMGSGPIKIVSDPVLTQESVFEAGVPWNAAAAAAQNGENDRWVIVAQALARDIARALLLPIGEGSFDLPAGAIRQNTLQGYGPGGAPANYPLGTSYLAPPAMLEINAADAVLAANQRHAIKTSAGALAPILPLLASVGAFAWIEIQDVDFAAFTNHQVIAASGPDTIVYQDTAPVTAFTMNENGVCLRFVANGTYWRVIYYGG